MHALALAVLLAGCSGAPATHERPEAVAAVEISVEVVGPAASRAALVLPARVKAEEEATLTARLPGRVTALPVAEGARVGGGDVVAVFDAPEARARLDAAHAELAAAELALGVAKRQYQRMEALRASEVVAEREHELAESEHRSAAARLRAAQAAVNELEAATHVRAPFAGVLVRRHLDVGADVEPGTPIVDVRSLGPVEVVVPVPETAVPLLAGATLTVQSGEGPWIPVRLRRLDGSTDVVTRTRTARLAFVSAGAAIEAGAYARVRLEPGPGPAPAPVAAGVAPAATVPVASLVRRGGLVGVFVVRDERAVLRWLRLGRVAGDRAEVLGGLSPGDSIVIAPGRLVDGTRVRVGA